MRAWAAQHTRRVRCDIRLLLRLDSRRVGAEQCAGRRDALGAVGAGQECHSASNIDPQPRPRNLLNVNEYLAHRRGSRLDADRSRRKSPILLSSQLVRAPQGWGQSSTPIHKRGLERLFGSVAEGPIPRPSLCRPQPLFKSIVAGRSRDAIRLLKRERLHSRRRADGSAGASDLPDRRRYGVAGFQVSSGSYSLMRRAIEAVFGPRFFWNTTPV